MLKFHTRQVPYYKFLFVIIQYNGQLIWLRAIYFIENMLYSELIL